MKRRLSVAVAVIGSPQVVILDEPTAGVDPEGRKLLWNIIKSLKNVGHSVIVSTHDIEEYGTLCTSFGIMVDGKMKESGNVVDIRSKYADIVVGRSNSSLVWADCCPLTLKAIAAKYRYFVDKFGCETESQLCTRDNDLCWFSLRSMGNRETQDKLKQKILNEVLLHPSLRETGNPIWFKSMEVVENFLQTALQHLASKSEGGCNGEYEEFPDIEYQIDGNELHREEITTMVAMKFTVAQQRLRFKSQFENEIKGDAMDGKRPISEGCLNRYPALSPTIIVVDVFTIKLSNHLDFHLQTDVKEIMTREDNIIQGPEFVNSRTCETFSIVQHKGNITTNIEWVALSLEDYERHIHLTIGCVPLADGRFILSGGLKPRRKTILSSPGAFLDLPTSPDSWNTMIAAPVSQPFVSFAKFGRYLVKVKVPKGPRLEINVKILEIRKSRVENETDEVAKTRSILHRVFWNSNIEFEQFYTQTLVCLLLLRCGLGPCAAIIDIENFLKVSLKNETENYASVEGDCTAGATRMGGGTNETFHKSSVKLRSGSERKGKPHVVPKSNLPARILPSTREIFYDCDTLPIQKMFSYEIESTDVSIIVGLKVKDKDSSFAFAFVQSSLVKDESFETLMDSTQLNNCPNRRFGYAKDGEQAVQIRNIVALVSMTEPKCEDIRLDSQYQNSQLCIKIFTI